MASAFREALGTGFRVHLTDGRAADALLVTVDEVGRRPGWESMSLLFTGPDDAFPQATYTVEHETLGVFDLFLVPIAGDGAGQQYEAVVSRPAPS